MRVTMELLGSTFADSTTPRWRAIEVFVKESSRCLVSTGPQRGHPDSQTRGRIPPGGERLSSRLRGSKILSFHFLWNMSDRWPTVIASSPNKFIAQSSIKLRTSLPRFAVSGTLRGSAARADLPEKSFPARPIGWAKSAARRLPPAEPALRRGETADPGAKDTAVLGHSNALETP